MSPEEFDAIIAEVASFVRSTIDDTNAEPVFTSAASWVEFDSQVHGNLRYQGPKLLEQLDRLRKDKHAGHQAALF